MAITNPTHVSTHFKRNWESYLQSVHNNLLYHREMFSALDQFLNEHFKNTPITLADFGSGDSSAIAGVLQDQKIHRYIGVDGVPELIQAASEVLSQVACEKEFICSDMQAAVGKLNKPINVMVCSYALHHLSFEDKKKFLQACKDKLESNGHFILIDGVLAVNQTRDEWLVELEKRYVKVNPGVTKEALEAFHEHIYNDDQPESVEAYRGIAKEQGWKNFEVVIDKGMFGFMVFSR